jgi:hypothetical protein
MAQYFWEKIKNNNANIMNGPKGWAHHELQQDIDVIL